MKRRTLFQMLVGLFAAPKLPAIAPKAPLTDIDKLFIRDAELLASRLRPRWNLIAGQWVKVELAPPQPVNPEYLSMPYEDWREELKINS